MAIPDGDGVTTPAGAGYSTITVKTNGSVSWNLMLGDGQKLTVVSPVISQEGYWPVYGRAYKYFLPWTDSHNTPKISSIYNGEVMGLLTVGADHSLTGDLTWIKTGWTNGYLDAGFALEATVLGSGYTNFSLPTKTQEIPLALYYGNLILTNGGLSSAITKRFFLNPNNSTTFSTTNYKATLSISMGSGKFSGTFMDPYLPLTGQKTKFNGVVIQNLNYGPASSLPRICLLIQGRRKSSHSDCRLEFAS